MDFYSVSEVRLIYVDAKNNNNKFYHITIDSNEEVNAVYGRVGASGTKTHCGSGRKIFVKKINEKLNKGYEVFHNLQEKQQDNSVGLLAISKKQLILENEPNKAILEQLIKELVSSNKHMITDFSGGKIHVEESGLVKTELGVLTLDAVYKARRILSEMETLFHKNRINDKFLDLLNDYLKLVPQVVPSQRGWGEYFLNSQDKFNKQIDFLNALEVSIEQYETTLTSTQQTQNEDLPQVFNHHLTLLEDENEFKRIKKFFDETKKDHHSSSHLNLKRVYVINYSDKELKEFDKVANKLGDKRLLWHGSRKFNILSILQKGLVIPKSNASHVTGRMFGDGVYFSNQSTKSLNYSFGYWDGRNRDHHCFMFLADVVMGKIFEASHKYAEKTFKENTKRNSYPVKGFDSTYARGGRNNIIEGGSSSYLQNDEIIVFDLKQIQLRYLCEFE